MNKKKYLPAVLLSLSNFTSSFSCDLFAGIIPGHCCNYDNSENQTNEIEIFDMNCGPIYVYEDPQNQQEAFKVNYNNFEGGPLPDDVEFEKYQCLENDKNVNLIRIPVRGRGNTTCSLGALGLRNLPKYKDFIQQTFGTTGLLVGAGTDPMHSRNEEDQQFWQKIANQENYQILIYTLLDFGSTDQRTGTLNRVATYTPASGSAGSIRRVLLDKNHYTALVDVDAAGADILAQKLINDYTDTSDYNTENVPPLNPLNQIPSDNFEDTREYNFDAFFPDFNPQNSDQDCWGND